MAEQVIVPGHTLPFEGKTKAQWMYRSHVASGSTKCSCGEPSPVLPKGRVGSLQGQLRDAEVKLRQARIDAAPFKIGDVVEAHCRDGWVTIVRNVEPQSWGSVWYRVSTRTKAGEWSGVVQQALGKVRAAASPTDETEGPAAPTHPKKDEQ